MLHGRVNTLASNSENVAAAVQRADLVVGAVLLPGAKAPKIVSEEMVAAMRPGSVVVDVAIDQGGCIATARPTTHSDPTYVVHGVVHYCVTNMPGAVPRTSTIGLSNATLPYGLVLADYGLAWSHLARSGTGQRCQRDQRESDSPRRCGSLGHGLHAALGRDRSAKSRVLSG